MSEGATALAFLGETLVTTDGERLQKHDGSPDYQAPWWTPFGGRATLHAWEGQVLALANEGAAIVREGIAARPSDVDIVYLNGYGFPTWRGGPMFYADTLGLDTTIAKLRALRELTGDDCWEPDSLLLQLAEKGQSLDSLN